MPDLAIVIVSWNVRELLASCLDSLYVDLLRSEVPASVWVVDNGSTDGTPQMVRERFAQVHLVAQQENLGFAAGNNVALDRLTPGSPTAGAPSHLWLLNPDTEVKPGATAGLIRALDGDPQAGVVGAKLLNPNGSLQHGAFQFPGLAQLAFELFPLPRRLYETRLNGRYPRHLYDRADPFHVGHPLGASMMVRRDAVADVGLLDEGYRMYCEEIDWCWRMERAGWVRLCAPAAEVIHHGGQSTSQVPMSSFVDLWTSRARLYARYQGSTTWLLAQFLVRMGMRLRMENGEPDMVQACRDIIQAWRDAR